MSPVYSGTLTSARAFAKEGRLEEWVHAYLLSDGNNQPFSEGLKLFERRFLGPVRMPLGWLCRCCGPEEGMTYRVNASGFERKVTRLEEAARQGADLPPLIVHFLVENGKETFELNDGNHRFEAYSRLGFREAEVIVWITEPGEYALFAEKYGAALGLE